MNHWSVFPEFVRAELRAGGPDPQISLLEELSAGQPLQERVWLMGCYGAHHCIPSAYAVWRKFRPHEVPRRPTVLRGWLAEHWAHLPVRTEMKNHRMLDKRAKCLYDFAVYAQRWNPAVFRSYQQLWDDIIPQVKYFGRYMAIKVLEMLRRFGDVPHIEAPDMRAKGGWSPRIALSWLWPKQAAVLADRTRNGTADVLLVELYAKKTQERLWDEYGISINLFQLQVLLCEYKEAVHGGFYPGAGHDEELAYLYTAKQHFGTLFLPVFRARSRLFLPEYLGELGGWDGPRKEKYVAFKKGGGQCELLQVKTS